MAADLPAVLVEDVALGGAGDRRGSLGVAVRDEADVVAVGLLCHRQAPALGLGPDLLLGGPGVAQREQRVRQLPLVQHAEDVALVLGEVGGPVQLAVPVAAVTTVA